MNLDELNRHSPYGQLVGTHIVAVDVERGEIEVQYLADERFANRIGTVAGAMIAGLLDSVTGLVANLDLPEDRVAVHKSMSVAYERPGTPGRLTGRGRVVERDGRVVRSRGELLDEAGDRVASAEALLRVVRYARSTD